MFLQALPAINKLPDAYVISAGKRNKVDVRMDVSCCRVIITIIEKGSFSEAAKELHYTQSGITHMMTRLEASLGFKVFKRHKYGVSLSNNGKVLLPHIKKLLNVHASLEKCIDSMNNEPVL